MYLYGTEKDNTKPMGDLNLSGVATGIQVRYSKDAKWHQWADYWLWW